MRSEILGSDSLCFVTSFFLSFFLNFLFRSSCYVFLMYVIFASTELYRGVFAFITLRCGSVCLAALRSLVYNLSRISRVLRVTLNKITLEPIIHQAFVTNISSTGSLSYQGILSTCDYHVAFFVILFFFYRTWLRNELRSDQPQGDDAGGGAPKILCKMTCRTYSLNMTRKLL